MALGDANVQDPAGSTQYDSNGDPYWLNPDGSVYDPYAGQPIIPSAGVTQSQAAASGINWQALLNQAATAAGSYVARQVNGQTVIYPNNTGGIATLNLQKILPFAALAVVALLMMKGGKSGS